MRRIGVALGSGLRARDIVGHVADVHLTVSPRQPTRRALDQQPKDAGMPLERAGQAQCLAGEPLQPGPQRHMWALARLWVALARLGRVGSERPGVRAPLIGARARAAPRLAHCLPRPPPLGL